MAAQGTLVVAAGFERRAYWGAEYNGPEMLKAAEKAAMDGVLPL